MRKRRFTSSAVTTRPSCRGLHIEHLEPRCLMAGDTYLINFQNDEATSVTRYLEDLGAVFEPRGGGFSYGWSSDHTDQARERSAHADQRFDTLIHIEVGQNWEFQLANGSYEVTVAVGDPGNNDGIHTINAEGVNFFNAVADTNVPMVMTKPVTVSDGRLTIDAGAAANMATRINYVHIVGLPNGPNASPAAPTITEPVVDGQVVNPSGVHMEAIGYSDPDFNAHKSTDWEIWTVGPGAEMVWQTLGIEGVEKLHTHFGDGIFVNSRAGQISIAGNTDHELRVRFRDDTGAVSGYATRLFHTGPESAVFPMELQDILASPAPTWTDAFAGTVELPDGTVLFSPDDAIIAIDLDPAQSASPNDEQVANAIDNTLAKYLNFGEVNSGFIISPSGGASILTGFQITTANDAVERDPATWQLFGTNDPIISTNHSTGTLENWTIIASGSVALPSARNTLGPVVSFTNSTVYASYRMVFTGVKNQAAANSMQIAEIDFFGTPAGTFTPPKLTIQDGVSGDPLLEIEAVAGAGNTVNHFPPLGAHGNVRVVIESGSTNLAINDSNLTFRDSQGVEQSIYLPDINLSPGQRLDLWVSITGSTYYGTAAQTEPDFSMQARLAPVPGVPYVASQPGFVIDLVGSNYRLPVNIAFVPDPGPDPDDPLYYVTELYGSIQVVTRDGTKQQFATGLLDYNPQGPISGSGEQGLTGIAVRRNPGNPEVYELYVGMLWDNGAPPGGAVHYPKVERITSAAGGLTMASRTVLLNMQPETQGQSHQISNISIGPDGKLYVHNGDGFTNQQVDPVAQRFDQFRGKVLRMNLDGTAPTDNPFYNAGNGINSEDYIFARGLRNPFGGAWRASDGKHYEVENGPSVDRFAQVNAGDNLGWNGSDASMTINAIYNWSPASAPVNITFVQRETFGGSQFPASKMDHAFISQSGTTYAPGPQANGKQITEFVLNASGGLVSGPTKLIEYIGQGRSSVVGLAAGPDGLYFTELYEETGASGATAVGARIYRVRYVNPLVGDYDIDGDVDNDDHGVWRASYGSNLLLAADGNRNGVVDTADYVVWRNAMAAGSAAAANATASSGNVSTNVSAEASANSASGAASSASAAAIFGDSTAGGEDERQSPSSTQIIDFALADRGLRPRFEAAARRGFATELLTAPPTNDDRALLLAISGELGGVEHPASTFAADEVRSTEENGAQEIDDLFAELELLRW